MKIYAIVSMFLVLYLGTWIYFFERYYYDLSESDDNFLYFTDFYNSVWLELITVYGVSLSDAYPVSTPAQGVAAFGCLASLVSLSIIIKIVYA